MEAAGGRPPKQPRRTRLARTLSLGPPGARPNRLGGIGCNGPLSGCGTPRPPAPQSVGSAETRSAGTGGFLGTGGKENRRIRRRGARARDPLWWAAVMVDGSCPGARGRRRYRTLEETRARYLGPRSPARHGGEERTPSGPASSGRIAAGHAIGGEWNAALADAVVEAPPAAGRPKAENPARATPDPPGGAQGDDDSARLFR